MTDVLGRRGVEVRTLGIGERGRGCEAVEDEPRARWVDEDGDGSHTGGTPGNALSFISRGAQDRVVTLERLLVGLLAAGLVVLGVGSLVSLAATTLTGPYTAPASVVVLLLVVSIIGGVAVGAKGRGWFRNPGYW